MKLSNKTIFIAGIQRSGTNFIRELINNNTKANARFGVQDWCNVDLDITHFWKHDFDDYIISNLEQLNWESIVIIKNPYSWVESICFRNFVDILDRRNDEYNIASEYQNSEKIKGVINGKYLNFNIEGLVNYYKDFYNFWIGKANLFIKYEDLLWNTKEELNYICSKFDMKKNKDFKLPYILNESPDFERMAINYYKYEKLHHIKRIDIDVINQTLGYEFFKKIGYRMK